MLHVHAWGGLPYISHIHVGMGRPKREEFLHHFGLKTGIDFDMGLGIVYKGTPVPLCINVYNVSIPNE